jgi:antagonist of KipI
MSLRIIKGGIQDTIQDLGRFGYQHLGINPGGVMDRLSAQIANALVGNPVDEAVIELHFPAAEIFFEHPALITITGADFMASVNGDEIPCLQPIAVSKYSILQFYRLRAGARAYLAVQGGFDIPKWFNSYSTNIKAMAGGYKGKTLQKDDEIRIRDHAELSVLLGKKEYHIFPWKASMNWNDEEEKILVVTGNEWNRLTSKSKERFLQKPFLITNQSDRMGYRLHGRALTMKKEEELVSSAVCFGTIQLLPEGQPIVLMADHQTTGGYPRIAHVISAHHSRMAQLRAGESIQFELTDQSTAEKLLLKQKQHLLQLQNACKFRLGEVLGWKS